MIKGKIFHNKTMTYTYLFPALYNEIPDFKELYNKTKNCYLVADGIVCITDQEHLRFPIPDKYKDDYNKFKDSRYSKFSGEHKLNICKAHGLTDEDIEYDVLFKTNNAKHNFAFLLGGQHILNELSTTDSEYWYRVNTLKESYNYNYPNK